MSPAEQIAPFLRQVSVATGIKPETMTGETKDHPAAKARQTAICLAYQLTALTMCDIAAYFHRDGCAVHYAMDRVLGRCRTDPGYARHYAQLLGQRKPLRELRPFKGKAARPAPVRQLSGTVESKLSAATHGYLGQLLPHAVDSKLSHAREQLAYWTMKKAASLGDQDRAQAAARILIWSGEVASCERRLRDLTRTAALTA